MNTRYGEVKFREYISPSIAKKIAEKGTIDIVVTTGKLSDDTKSIFKDNNITVYNPTKEKVYEVLRELEKERKEKITEKE